MRLNISVSERKAVVGGVQQVPASLFSAVTSGLEKLNIPVDRLVENVGLPMWHYEDPRTLVPGVHYFRLFGAGARAFGSESCSGIFPGHLPIAAYGIVGRQITRTVTVYDSVRTACDTMNRITNISTYRAVENDGRLWWFRQRHQEADSGLRQVELMTIAYMIDIVRLGAGPDWRPEAIVFESDAIPGVERLEQFADADLRWRQGISGIEIPRSLLARRIGSSDPRVVCATDDPSAYQPPSDDFVPSLQQVIRSYLCFGQPRVEEIADAAGLGVRSLQRRLAREGLTFKRVVDQTRFFTATGLMHDPGIPLVEIAHYLGYGDQANFNHAFRRWAGVAPSEYRRQLHPG